MTSARTKPFLTVGRPWDVAMKVLMRTSVVTLGLLLCAQASLRLLQLPATVVFVFVAILLLLVLILALILRRRFEERLRDLLYLATGVACLPIPPLLIFILALVLRLRFGWRLRDLLPGLLLLEPFVLRAISSYFDFKLLDSGTLTWFLFVNLFLALPWMVGIAVGSAVTARRLRTCETL
jgi:hypothetical protein